MIGKILKFLFLNILILPYLCMAEDLDQENDYNNLLLMNISYSIQNNYRDHWFAEDKARHFIGSFISTIFISQICCRSLNEPADRSKVLSAGSVFAFGLVKEFSDYRKQDNYFSLKDLSANITGIIFGLIILNVK